MSTWKQKTIWQLVNDDGSLVTGWVKIGDYWYYMDSTGTMYQEKWLQDNGKWYYLDDNGRMVTGWQKIKNKDYCFANDGSLYVSCTTPDGYEVDESGIWQDSLLSDSGAEFIGSWEGLFLKAYEDPYYPGNQNWWTIGYGTTYAVTPSAFPNGLDSTCTKEQAIKWLKDEAKNCAETIKSALDSANVTLNQSELDACISFAYNCGTGALLGSTFWKNVIAGVRNETLRTNLCAWSKANGVTSAGLLKRRNSEADLFLNADYTGNN